MADAAILEIFSDYTWPWCYFITGCIERLKKEYEIKTRWTAYPLHPHTPHEGLTLEQHFSDSSKEDINEKKDKWKQAAEKAGLPFGDRNSTYNSRLAHELGKLAESQGKGDEFHNAVFRAYFVDGKNIGKIPILTELAGFVGLSEEEAQDVLEIRTYNKDVDADWSRALKVDPEYIPSVMVNGKLLENPQGYESFERFMQKNSVVRRVPNE